MKNVCRVAFMHQKRGEKHKAGKNDVTNHPNTILKGRGNVSKREMSPPNLGNLENAEKCSEMVTKTNKKKSRNAVNFILLQKNCFCENYSIYHGSGTILLKKSSKTVPAAH